MPTTPPTYERDPRSYDEIMLAAREMRAGYLRELFGKLRTLFSARDTHAQIDPDAAQLLFLPLPHR